MKNLVFLAAGMFLIASACNSPKGQEKTTDEQSTNTVAVNSTTNDLHDHSAHEANSNEPKAAIEFEKVQHDFGSVKEGDVVRYAYKFKNTGDNPLIIKDAQPSCGCTTPVVPKEPIAPGATSEIVAEFNTQGKPGQNSKTIKVIANTEPIETILTLTGMVEGTGQVSVPNGPVK